MENWYRATTWNDMIASEFEVRLKRSRSQKAQYLRIQGMALRDNHPEVAIMLLKRCVEMRDDCSTALAMACIGGIWLKQGDIGGAIDCFGLATTQEQNVPDFATNAPTDFCFLVTLHQKVELYERALGILRWLAPVEFGAAGYARNGAMAVILAHQGEAKTAAVYAEKALQCVLDKSASLPSGLKPHPNAVVSQIDNPFTVRLIEIHAAGDRPR